MGYFSNGTEGMDYQERYCSKCWHDRDERCPIWMLHMTYPYKRDPETEVILNALIPLSKDGLNNEQCTQFVSSGSVDADFHQFRQKQIEEQSALERWNKGEAVKLGMQP